MSVLGGRGMPAAGSQVAPSPPSAPLLFRCPNCQVETSDTACDLCGRPLTRRDLTPLTSQDPQGVPVTEAPDGSQTKGS